MVYDEESLPVWLRDSLVNNLSLIAEDSYWAQARPPLGDWCFPLGAFGLLESPRSCPQMCCIPCEWLGSLPIVYFYPELARQTLRTFKQYQLDNGEVPFAIGRVASLPDFTTPKYYWQVSCNGPWYLMLIDRLWTCTGDDSVLREFYESARQSNTFTMSLSTGPEGVISMPDIGGMEGFEMGEWAGMTAHLAFLRLASLRIMRRMAEAMGDDVYVAECQQWLDDGTSALEHELWTDGYYLNFYDKKTNEKSDAVMGYQFDGQWVAWSHGDGDLAQHERIQSTLEKIRCCNAALTPNDGAANFAQPDGTAMPTDDTVAEYGPYAYFPPHGLILAMTYMYAGDKEFGLEFARKIWRNMILTHRHPWDLPNMVRGDTGERIVGTEYYQNMILWAMPAALEGEHLGGPCRENGLVHRVLRAAGVTQ